MKTIAAWLLLLVTTSATAGVTIPERDDDGALLSTIKLTHPGWQYQHASFEATTCKLNSHVEIMPDGTDPGYGVLKFYDNADVELVQGGSESDADFQIRLDSNCKKTILDWTPTHDYMIIGGQMRQQTAPSGNVRMWVVGVPGIPAGAGGSKVFINNLNMKFLANSESMVADGRTPKELLYNDPIPGTNTMRYQFVADGLGVQHTIHVSMEIFKP